MGGGHYYRDLEYRQAEHHEETRRRHWQEAVNVEYFRRTGDPFVDDEPEQTRLGYDVGLTPVEAVKSILARTSNEQRRANDQVKHYAKVNNDL